MNYKTRYREWLLRGDEQTQNELLALSEAEREERFYTELAFGTAGLRGILGAGTNRMNEYVVRRATEGLCQYLATIPGAKERGVCIAYDSRKYSDVFALNAALVLAANCYRAYLFSSLRAVPQLSFTLQHYGCIAGIVITASHNPAIYNGYKVYWEHGGQLGPVQAEAVYAAMQQADYFNVPSLSREEALASGLLTMVDTEADEAYYTATQTLLLNPSLLQEYGPKLNLVYTPLHGAGSIPVRELLRRVGVTEVHVVPEQELPDPCFPTVAAPNPEDAQAFTLAKKFADEKHADVLLATDPDADRLGVCVRIADGSFKVLSGNQIGCLLLHTILSTLDSKGKLPKNALVVKSIVSTHLADAICARYQVQLTDVLTGFRFISEIVDTCARTGQHTFLFGFEESYGFLAGGFSRDKDAICACMLIAELCASCMARGITLYDALTQLYEEFGYYREGVKEYTLTGKAGMERINAAMEALRAHPPKELAGTPVDVFEDYAARKLINSDGTSLPLSLPQSNMLRLLLQDGSWIVARPSGTEPKLKLYIGVIASTEEQAEQMLGVFMNAMDALLASMLAGTPAGTLSL